MADPIDPRDFGRLEAEVKNLQTEVAGLRSDVSELLAMANKGKGGLWMFNTGLVALGGIGAWLVEHFLRR